MPPSPPSCIEERKARRRRKKKLEEVKEGITNIEMLLGANLGGKFGCIDS
jgi:hypothetical protein